MRILVENGCYGLRNMGDVAMLQVAISRLSDMWPEAAIEVITEEPDLLAAYSPKAHPIDARGRQIWFDNRFLFGPFCRMPGGVIAKAFSRVARQVRRHWPAVTHSLIQLNAKRRGMSSEQVDAFVESVLRADLVAVSGGGDINDAFFRYATTLLDVLEMSARRGIPTAMFGQGIGPITNGKLRARAKAVLPMVDLIAIRESRAARAFLNSLGVAQDRVITTGDDAIESAYRSRPEKMGAGIGVNLRVTVYSEVDNGHVEMVRAVLLNAVEKYNAPLIPVPISFYGKESDPATLRQLLAGYADGSDGGQSLDNPARIIERVGCCRIVVTGSYHPAVFALAQGIAVVCLANSAYYIDKFLGLADQFGCGCQVLCLGDEHIGDKLAAGIDAAWKSAEHVRSPLLAAAGRQVGLSRAAYQRIYELVECGKAKTTSQKRA